MFLYTQYASRSLAGADFDKTNLFSADGKHFYFNATQVSEFACGGFKIVSQNFALILI
jgi:hypothetical protein